MTGFTTSRLPEHAFAVDTSTTLDRLLHQVSNPPLAGMSCTSTNINAIWNDTPACFVTGADDTAPMMNERVAIGGTAQETYEEEISRAYLALSPDYQRLVTIAVDHGDIVEEYGATSPQAMMVREMYAAAMFEGACNGARLPPLDPLIAMPHGSKEDLMDGVMPFSEFLNRETDEAYLAFVNVCDSIDPDLMAVAKAKSSPDVYTERQMSGPEWDEPKQLEVAKFDKLEAKSDILADDPSIKGMHICDSTCGPVKINVTTKATSSSAMLAACNAATKPSASIIPRPTTTSPQSRATNLCALARRSEGFVANTIAPETCKVPTFKASSVRANNA